MDREFYNYMFSNPGTKVDFGDSAEALNVATRAMRKNRVPSERWIMVSSYWSYVPTIDPISGNQFP